MSLSEPSLLLAIELFTLTLLVQHIAALEIGPGETAEWRNKPDTGNKQEIKQEIKLQWHRK